MLKVVVLLLAFAANASATVTPAPQATRREPDRCAPNPCLNGGTCRGAGDDFSCACAGSYSGKVCEMKCGKSELVSYRLAGTFKLSGTALGASDGEWLLPGADERTGGTQLVTTTAPNLVLRIHAGGRRVSVVSLELPHNVHQLIAGTEAYTNMLHSVPRNVCGAAFGTLNGTTLVWDACTTPASYGTRSWTSAEPPTGPGCLKNMGDEGNIWCGGWACPLGSLSPGDNPVTRPPVWSLPLPPFRFAGPDLKSFVTDHFDVPNDRKNARTQMSFTAAIEIGRTSETTPDCACP